MVLALVILHNVRKPAGQEVLTLLTSPASNAAEFFKLAAHNPGGVTVDLHRSPAVFRPGEIVNASIRLNRPAALFGLRRGPSGNARVIFPPTPG